MAASVVVTMRVTIDGDGIVEPVAVWTARPLEGGVLTRVFVHTGDTVRVGQVVAQLDSTAAWSSARDLGSQVATLQIELDRLTQSAPVELERSRIAVADAEARLARARTDLRQRMADFGISGDADSVARASGSRIHVGLDGPSADFMSAEAALANARTQVSTAALDTFDIQHKREELSRARLALTTSREHLRRLRITAPASGVVLTDQLDQLTGLAVAAGQPVLDIADLSHWHATLGVSERDVYRISVGDTADIEIPAFAALPVDRFQGHVESVGFQPANAAGGSQTLPGAQVAGYRVTVRLDSIDLGASSRNGMRRGYVVHGKIISKAERAFKVFLEEIRDRVRGVTH
ncbi:MAG TPA: efflux RND transporter periplasmic adaptor subunit [Gemmatimonadaceae bacterium]|nr:efflux RND transporter periplasmic adaptor subunit [Gemmatimonadaceae bacterium]